MFATYEDAAFNSVFARIRDFLVNLYEYIMDHYVRR